MNKHNRIPTALALMTTVTFLDGGCGSDVHDIHNENEVFTTATLTLTPEVGGMPIVVSWDDPDGDGGDPPKIDTLTLSAGSYNVAVTFLNKLETPQEDITSEVRDEADEHMVFFTGTAVNGPASDMPMAPLTHAYSDLDSKQLPIGLANKLTAAIGTGMLTVTLRHLPPVNDVAVKTATTAATVRAMDLTAIGGSSDVQVTFPVTVQ